ncbi:MAG: hypothetical protein KF799_12045 [Bdellovibrionales bacterium]|nr:hypothetical protein [Bdellovibrionales bacterium]
MLSKILWQTLRHALFIALAMVVFRISTLVFYTPDDGVNGFGGAILVGILLYLTFVSLETLLQGGVFQMLKRRQWLSLTALAGRVIAQVIFCLLAIESAYQLTLVFDTWGPMRTADGYWIPLLTFIGAILLFELLFQGLWLLTQRIVRLLLRRTPPLEPQA